MVFIIHTIFILINAIKINNLVGICKDEDVIGYKRKPILAGPERVASAQACRYVDEVLYDDVPLIVTKEFIEKQ